MLEADPCHLLSDLFTVEKTLHGGLPRKTILHYKFPMKIVSACLAGIPCRFDCQAKERTLIKEWVESGEAIAVCPEQLGGLSTPRPPAEIQGDKVITNQGVDVTAEYQLGAQKSLEIALENNVTEAYLKSRSPMCGYKKIYDGTYSGKLVEGHGIFAQALLKNGITVNEVD